jgi:hypothetical protein
MEPIIKNIISIPRTGQHFTEASLEFYHQLINIEFTYCEFYNCCNQRPCIKSKCYQKNHDFDLKNPDGKDGIIINDNEKYLFLYRDNLLEQIESFFRLHLKVQGVIHSQDIYIDYSNINLFDMFKDFVIEWRTYYKQIFSKYLIKKSNILQIEFNEYLLNFNEIFKKILLFFDIPINEEFIEKTKKFINPVQTKRIAPQFYNKLNDCVNQLINID